MNYYEHHIGDYAEATAHLTFVEDAAYTRMIRKYYAQEKPLPADVKAVQRLVGARTKEEREAVETILGEFFVLQDDGWHNGRCDAELARYLDKTEGRDAKREAEKERQRLHRERRKELFATLRGHDIVPPFDTPTSELVTLLSQVRSQPVTQAVTRDATATQSPDTSHQTPDLKPNADDDTTDYGYEPPSEAPLPPPAELPAGDDNPAITLAVKLRTWGVNATFTQPAVQDWSKREVPHDILSQAVALAREQKGDAKIAPNYLVPIVEKLLAQQAMPALTAQQKQHVTDDWYRSKAGIERKGRELGLFPRGSESHDDFKDRIFAVLRKGAKA